MNLLIFGSTGATGRELVDQALEHGHSVTAFARNPVDLATEHFNLRVLKGDILDGSSVDDAVQNQHAVISALGVRTLGKNTTISTGTKNIIMAMERHGVKRLVFMSSIGVGESKIQQKSLGFLYNRFVIPIFLKNMFQDKEVQERYVRESDLDWTIVRPAILTNGQRTGRYRVFKHNDTDIRHSISRGDVADLILRELSMDEHIRECVSVSD